MEQTWCDNARLTQILASIGHHKDFVNGSSFLFYFYFYQNK